MADSAGIRKAARLGKLWQSREDAFKAMWNLPYGPTLDAARATYRKAHQAYETEKERQQGK